MHDDGVIKYDLDYRKSAPYAIHSELMFWRDRMYYHKLIGQYPDGIGYGNISMRGGTGFVISGTQTGGVYPIEQLHFSFVKDFNIDKNHIQANGPIAPSSEALTHAALYELNKDIGGIIHIHDTNIWNILLNKVPTTSSDIEYGTVEMAREIQRVADDSGVIVMAGHMDGVIFFGKTLDEAGKIAQSYHK